MLEETEKLKPLYIGGRNIKCVVTLDKLTGSSQKFEHTVIMQPSNLFPGIYPREMKT
jgi:hypothetical protein